MTKNLCFLKKCFIKNYELLSVYIKTADNYTQTKNMENRHPENKSAKDFDKTLRDLKQFF